MIHILEFKLDKETMEVLDFLKTKFIGLNNSRENISDLPNFEIFSVLHIAEAKVGLKELRKQVAYQRSKYDLITVNPSSKGGASFAARDGRVDLIRINPTSNLSMFNTRFGRRIAEYGKIVEVDLSSIFQKVNASSLRPLIRVINALKKGKIPFFLNQIPKKKMHLRSYRGLQAVGRQLGIPNYMSDPVVLVRRLQDNHKKLENNMVFSGVEVEEW